MNDKPEYFLLIFVGLLTLEWLRLHFVETISRRLEPGFCQASLQCSRSVPLSKFDLWTRDSSPEVTKQMHN